MSKRAGKKGISILRRLLVICLSLFFIAFEIVLYYVVLAAYVNSTWVFLLVRFIGAVSAFYLYSSKSNSNYKLTWIIAILVMPLSGTLIFLCFGNGRMLPKKKYHKIEIALANYIGSNDVISYIQKVDKIGYKHLHLINNLTGLQAYANTESIFYSSINDKHNQFLEDLRSAEKYIFIETFIVAKGTLWNEICEILKEKASQGIEIKILYDDIGSKLRKPRADFELLRGYLNVKIKAYNPMRENLTPGLNYRNHRKIAIIDGKYAYIGGDNLADEYVNRDSPYGFWRDNCLRLKGDAIHNLLLLFAQTWFMSTTETLDVHKYKTEHNVKNDSIHMPFGDGPMNNADPAYEVYLSLINNARTSIYISTPYFIIDDNFIGAIERACRSGVDVRILLPHIPDKKLVFTMSRAHYRDILEAGGKIYEYSPGFNHAKSIVVDNKYAILGTINCDYRSFFLHFECGDLLMYDKSVTDLNIDFINALGQSEEISLESWKKRPLYRKIVEFIVRAISPLL